MQLSQQHFLSIVNVESGLGGMTAETLSVDCIPRVGVGSGLMDTINTHSTIVDHHT